MQKVFLFPSSFYPIFTILIEVFIFSNIKLTKKMHGYIPFLYISQDSDLFYIVSNLTKQKRC
ncbi:hypothetical protein AS29_017420 [Bacillus sp. SJS]|nr:hypothetical protein AS29_017420 [Bacillus sp. SJS]